MPGRLKIDFDFRDKLWRGVSCSDVLPGNQAGDRRIETHHLPPHLEGGHRHQPKLTRGWHNLHLRMDWVGRPSWHIFWIYHTHRIIPRNSLPALFFAPYIFSCHHGGVSKLKPWGSRGVSCPMKSVEEEATSLPITGTSKAMSAALDGKRGSLQKAGAAIAGAAGGGRRWASLPIPWSTSDPWIGKSPATG